MSTNLVVLYIDPGTGSLIISTAIAIGLTLLFTLKGFFYKLLSLLSGKRVKGKNDFSGQLVIFSEGKNYSRVFSPVVEELIKREVKFAYLTADKNDPLLQIASPFLESHYIGPIKQAIIFMNTLKAKMCVMTTPQLDILTLKRSKHVLHYCHLIHSPTDIHAYKKFAFDYFDSVLCSSTFQIDNLRQLETDRKSQHKILLEAGCTYLDDATINTNQAGKAILLAPTWGDKSFFSTCGIEIIENLLQGEHKIIFRPHPQSWISDKELLLEVEKKYENHPKFLIDKAVDNTSAILQSALMICDLSGMVYDYVFTNKKPVIAIDFKWDDGGYESSDISHPSSTTHLVSEVGKFIKTEEINNISAIAKSVMKIKISDEMIDKHIFNFKNATSVATTQIVQLFNIL